MIVPILGLSSYYFIFVFPLICSPCAKHYILFSGSIFKECWNKPFLLWVWHSPLSFLFSLPLRRIHARRVELQMGGGVGGVGVQILLQCFLYVWGPFFCLSPCPHTSTPQEKEGRGEGVHWVLQNLTSLGPEGYVTILIQMYSMPSISSPPGTERFQASFCKTY